LDLRVLVGEIFSFASLLLNAADPTFTFKVEEYTAETPAWALFGAEEEGFDPTDLRYRKSKHHPMYTKYDDEGIPTHDHDKKEISSEERAVLRKQMKVKMDNIGVGSVVTELKSGERRIEDASLMFRGKVMTK
jgi:hypothetical protein